jgi:HD-like signal output (HDOD) protein/ActR/RegA family two-component response regulator
VKSILFVDDEPALLAGLRSRLHSLASRWEMTFLGSGEAAVKALESRPYDVIVTDLRMPRMDGEELLRIVSTRWPEVIRMVLSGSTDPQQTSRLATLAHQFISQPCECARLENLITRGLALHDLLHQPRLRSLVGRIRSLPTIPRIYARLRSVLADDAATAADVAKVVAADPAIAAKILQMVNSAFFRLPRRITKIEQAVTYLGFAAIRNLTLSVEVFASFSSTAAAGALNFEKLQQHVREVAGAARALAPKTLEDDAMLAGLLHDIGYWILATQCPAELAQAVDLAVDQAMHLHAAEAEVIGASHAEIGAYLLGLWGLPYTVIEAVACHHAPEAVPQQEFDVLASLVAAQALVPGKDADAFGRALIEDASVGAAYFQALRAPISWPEAQQRVTASLQDSRGET